MMIFRLALGTAWGRALCALAPLLLAATAQANPASDVAATQHAAPEALPQGIGSFTFSGWSGPAFAVHTYVPEGVEAASAPILIVMHGQERDPRRYLREWTAIADQYGFIAVAPEFSRRQFETSRQYNMGHLTELGSTELRPRELWSFAAIEPLFDEVAARLGSDQQSYTLYGHSAGSQYVHRFMLTQRETRAARFLAANAGWYTLPTFALEYPYGLNGTDLGTDDLQAALGRDLVILLGDRDNDPDSSSLNKTEGAMMQGKHRFERGQFFHDFGKEMARRQGWEFGWSLRIIPGVAHSNGGIAKGAGDLVAGLSYAEEPAAGQ